MRTRGRRVRCGMRLRLLEETGSRMVAGIADPVKVREDGDWGTSVPFAQGSPSAPREAQEAPCYTAARSSRVLTHACGRTTPSHTPADPAVHGARRTRRVDRRELKASGGKNRRNTLGCRQHEAAAGGRRPLRTPDPALEPEDARLHLRGAQRHPHHRPAQTVTRLDDALEFVRETIRRGDIVLFVGTKKQAQESVSRRPSAAGSTTSTTAGWAARSPTSRPSSAASSASRRSRSGATPASSSA